MNKGVSILVCTFNGAERLPQTLAHLASQIVPSNLNWEIIVVDNASTDNTIQVVKHEWSKYILPNVEFSLISEPRPGKINALELGTRHCKYEYFIICDDDNWLSKFYVQKTFDLLESDQCIGAVGGQVIAVNDSGRLPEWFEQYKEGYAVGQQGRARGDISSRGYVFGAGLGTRTALYREVYDGFPSLLVGRQGEILSAGEDSEYCQRLLLKNYILFYEPTLTLKHYLPEFRLQTSYRERLFAGLKDADKILASYLLVNKLRKKLSGSVMNKIRLLIISPIRILFARSEDSLDEQKKTLMYLLNIKSGKHSHFDLIRKFTSTENF